MTVRRPTDEQTAMQKTSGLSWELAVNDNEQESRQVNSQESKSTIDKEGRECAPATVKKKKQERRERAPATE